MFLASLYFQMDVFEAITQFSVTMQASAGVLIGKETVRQNLFTYRNALLEETVAFSHMARLLANCECLSSPCTMDEFFTTRPKCFHVQLDKTGSAHSFDKMKSTFFKGLLFQFEEFFPEGVFKDFEVFNPVVMPDKQMNMATYGDQKIINLITRFNINPDAALMQWKKVLRHLITEESEYCSKKYFDIGKDPSLFCSFYMNKDIGWGEDVLNYYKLS